MIIALLPGDTVTLTDGTSREVLGFSAVSRKVTAYVSSGFESPDKVSLSKITHVNDTPVELHGGVVFETPGKFKRKVHLPQPGDIISAVDDDGLEVQMTLKRYKLKKTELAKGLRLIGSTDSDEITVRFATLTELPGSKHSAASVKRVYSEYLGV